MKIIRVFDNFVLYIYACLKPIIRKKLFCAGAKNVILIATKGNLSITSLSFGD